MQLLAGRTGKTGAGDMAEFMGQQFLPAIDQPAFLGGKRLVDDEYRKEIGRKGIGATAKKQAAVFEKARNPVDGKPIKLLGNRSRPDEQLSRDAIGLTQD